MRKGFTLVEIMIVVAIIATLAAIALPGILRARMLSNDAIAKKTLVAMSTALESYAADNGVYPTSDPESIEPKAKGGMLVSANDGMLVSANPPYINRRYCGQLIDGYFYFCNFQGSGYSITATPSECLEDSKAVRNKYTVTTGRELTVTSCNEASTGIIQAPPPPPSNLTLP